MQGRDLFEMIVFCGFTLANLNASFLCCKVHVPVNLADKLMLNSKLHTLTVSFVL